MKPKTYWIVYGVLITLTATTTAVAFLPLGEWHTVAALAIAAAKATLVLLIFMHLWQSPRLTWVVIAGGVYWLGILLALTFADYLTRPWGQY